MNNNPLINRPKHKHGAIDFDAIKLEHFMPAFNPDGSDLGYPVFPGVMANIYLFTGTEVGRIGDYIDYSNMTIEEAID